MLTFASAQAYSTQSSTLDDDNDTLNGKTIYGSHKQTYQDLAILQPLTNSATYVYLVNSRVTRKNYAMKVFEYNSKQPHLYFKNGSRFACLRHPNIVSHLYMEERMEAKINDKHVNVSYIIMEYASNGTFFDFLKHHRAEIDEKLARTYFHQLIEGLHHMHKHGIAHMDIKPDNLLLDQDFNLKIADFDMAHYKDDAIVISKGTRNFRAPEVNQGKCVDTKAADIYSAGIILFILKARGMLPYVEAKETAKPSFSGLLCKNSERPWICNENSQEDKIKTSFDKDFLDLFIAMTKLDPCERASIEDIKASKWYNGPCYTAKELKGAMGRLFSK